MKKYYCLILVLSFYTICNAQNLVPNGDFEQYYHCPTNISQLDSAKFWITPTTGTSDYFNQCSNNTAGVPYNQLGFQQTHSGLGYAGIHRYNQSHINYREYIEVRLDTTLSAKTCYHFEMYINLSNKSRYSTYEIGAYFSNTIINGVNNFAPLPFTPQINNSLDNPPDTLNWILVSGDYTALGGEQYLIIGNFNDDAATDPTAVNVNPTAVSDGSYVYIDDVSLTLTVCPDGINEQNENGITVFPNPVADELNVRLNNYGPSEIILYDITSRVVFQQNFSNSVTVNTEQFAKGIYFYEVINENGLIRNGKVIKQ